MNIEEVVAKWCLKENNKQASVDMWNSMAQSFGEHTLPSFEDRSFLQLLHKYKMRPTAVQLKAELYRVQRPRKPPFKGNIYNEGEFEKLFQIVNGTPIELAVLLGAFYGLRRSEIVGLK